MADPRRDLRTGPPPRYRVVERDRRLVVIDTTGEAIGRDPVAPIPAEGRWFPQRLSFDGSAAVTTRAFYDESAPRTIRLDPGSARTVRIAAGLALAALAGIAAAMMAEPLSIVPIGIVLGKARAPARRAITRWLDTVAREGR